MARSETGHSLRVVPTALWYNCDMAKRDLPWVEMLTGSWSGPLRLRVRGLSMTPTLRPGDEVLTEPVEAAALHPGDWIVVQANGGPFIHRFLGCTPEGQLLTKGDAHRAPDPPWPPEALLGRAVALSRAGETLPVASSSLRERTKTQWHRLLAAVWSLGQRAGLLACLLALLLPLTVGAAVTLVSFEAQPQENSIFITWETASEVNMSGFYVQRGLHEAGPYERLPIGETPDFIGAEGDIIGAT
ncbi:MAG: S24/S26 family peptidase, partial [Chloroflexota bacterium]|nr:S24/S26 family peptidase [Chloroflexota bacterium]